MKALIVHIMLTVYRYFNVVAGLAILPFAVVIDVLIDGCVILCPQWRPVAWLATHRCQLAILATLSTLGWLVSITQCPLNAGLCVCELQRVPEGGGVPLVSFAGSTFMWHELSTAQLVAIIPAALRVAAQSVVEILRRHPVLGASLCMCVFVLLR